LSAKLQGEKRMAAADKTEEKTFEAFNLSFPQWLAGI